MALKTLKDIDISNKTILYRSPYDIATKKQNDEYIITDDSRIRATLPTLEYMLAQNCKIVVVTWVKRPENREPELSTNAHAKALSGLLNRPVKHINECVGPEVQNEISNLQPQEILMLENTRYHKEEFEDDDNFAQDLTKGCDLVVYDGFPQAHRKHSSTTGILRHLPSCAGLYFVEEYNALNNLLDGAEKPFVTIIGGAKVSDKIEAVKTFSEKADILLLGGGLANTFLKAEGKEMSKSFIEDAYVDEAKDEKQDWVEYAQEILSSIEEKSVENLTTIQKDSSNDSSIKLRKIVPPLDLVVAEEENSTETQVVPAYRETNVVPQNTAAYDIGPKTAELYTEIINQAKTVFWAGPMGVFEQEPFSAGTKAIAEAVANTQAKTIVAGGDTIDALKEFANPEKIDYTSLAGGATIEFLSGKQLPVVQVLLQN